MVSGRLDAAGLDLARAFALPARASCCAASPSRPRPEAAGPASSADEAVLAARNVPCISVTHDVDEALLLDAEVFRIDAGRIVAFGQAHNILADERMRLLNALG